MAEWLKAAVLKTVSGVTRSGVRIPLPPPEYKSFSASRNRLLCAAGILCRRIPRRAGHWVGLHDQESEPETALGLEALERSP